MHIQAYLNFDGRADEALTFYTNALDAKVGMVMRFKDAPPGACSGPQPNPEKVMHSEIRIGETVLMISDCFCTNAPKFEGISLALTVENEADMPRIFAALGEGGTIKMPLAPTFFAKQFGMLVDRFGVSWTVIVPKKM